MALLVAGGFAAGTVVTLGTGLLYGLKIQIRKVSEGYMFEVVEDLGKVYNDALALIKGATKLTESAGRVLADLAARAQQLIRQYLLGDLFEKLKEFSLKKEGDGEIVAFLRDICGHLRSLCEKLFNEALMSAEMLEVGAICIRNVASLFLTFLDTLPELVCDVHMKALIKYKQ